MLEAQREAPQEDEEKPTELLRTVTAMGSCCLSSAGLDVLVRAPH